MAYKHTKQYRLYGYDYAQPGAYFITIVTKDRIHYFGEISNAVMQYTAIGNYVVDNIRAVQERKKDLTIEAWVVMPNHVHLLLTITTEKVDYSAVSGIQPLISQSISAFVNHFKGRVKKWCLANGADAFDWQARFHDRVVRNKEEYTNIARYIENNIANWEQDKEFLP